jgi:RNA polymerase sigma factor (sigma-70 family)
MSLTNAPMAQRDLPSFTSCVRAFEAELDYLTRCLRRHGVSPVDAEDLVQDVFVVMCRRWGDFRPERPVRPWLAGIAFHVAKSHLRRHGREVLKSDIDLEDGRPVAEDRLMSEGARKLVLQVLASLPERHRTALVMHDLDEMAVPEIAQLLGIPLASAYTRIRRARLAFADGVKRQEERAQGLGRRGPLIGLEALFVIERQPPHVGAGFRQRAAARARITAAEIGAGRWPAAASGAGWSVSPIIVRVAEGVGVAALLGAATIFVWSLARSPGHDARATTGSAPAISASQAATGIAGDRRGRAGQVALGRAVPRLITPARAHGGRLNQGLVGYWQFEERTGTRKAHDASSLGNDCALHRLKAELGWVDASITGGKSLGPGGWLHCKQAPLAAGTGTEVSAALWMRIDRVRGFLGTMLSRKLSPGGDNLFYFGVQRNDLVLRSAVWQPDRLAVPLANPQGRWIHVAFTRRRDGVTKLYVDGAVAAEEHARPLPAPATEEPLVIAAEFRDGKNNWAAKRFIGSLDEVMLYDRALGDDEIAEIASGGAPTTEADVGPVGAN